MASLMDEGPVTKKNIKNLDEEEKNTESEKDDDDEDEQGAESQPAPHRLTADGHPCKV
jgi:hypothetical protein